MNRTNVKVLSVGYGVLFLIVAIAVLLEIAADAAFGQTNTPPGGGTSGAPSQWATLAYIVPLAAPFVVALLKALMTRMNVAVSKNLLPFACLGVAVVLGLVLDLTGQLHVPLWIYAPIAGAVGVGVREFMDKGLGLLNVAGWGDSSKTPVTNPAAQ